MSVEVRLTGLTLYPIKSCGGIELTEGVLTPHGLEWDREWMVIDPAGHFLTQRNHPRMALIRPRLESEFLVVTAPKVAPLYLSLLKSPTEGTVMATVWSHSTEAWPAGTEADRWFSQFLGTPARLVRWNRSLHRPCPAEWTGGIAAEARFADAYPYLLMSEATLADLNRRIPGGGLLPMNRFRPNLVIDGGEAGIEDALPEITTPTATLRAVKPCTRCRITNTDQETGEVGLQPLQTLATYRKDPRFNAPVVGQNLILIRGTGSRLVRGETLRLQSAGGSLP